MKYRRRIRNIRGNGTGVLNVAPDLLKFPSADGDLKPLYDLSPEELVSIETFFRIESLLKIPQLDVKDPRSALTLVCILNDSSVLKEKINHLEFCKIADAVEELVSISDSGMRLLREISGVEIKCPFIIDMRVREELKALLEKDIVFLKRELKEKKYNQDIINVLFKNHSEIERSIICYVVERHELLVDILPYSYRSSGSTSIEDIIKHLRHLYPVKSLKAALAPDSTLFDSGLLDIDDSCIADASSWGKVDLVFRSDVFSFSLPTKSNSSFKFDWKKIYTPSYDLKEVILAEKEKSHILALLRDYKKSQQRGQQKRLTFLLSGLPGTGKSMTAEAIAHSLGLKILRIQVGEIESKNLPNIINYAMARGKNKNMMILFEECEDLLWKNYSLGISSPWMKLIFEEFKGVACFTTNYKVSDDFLRRITYFLEFKTPNARIRGHILKNELKKICSTGETALSIPEGKIEMIAGEYKVPGGFYQQALQLAQSISSEQAITESSLRESMNIIEERLGIEGPQDEREAIVEISSLHLPEEDKNRIERFVELCKSKITLRKANLKVPKTFLFSGPPGTGKTMAAEAIAHALGMKIKTITPSTLLSPFVGQTEKQIRDEFQSAQKSGYVLFIDEAEGLLLDRTNARNSWEKTQADEFLQQIENFNGILIAATNWTSMMDPAFSRRFLFQLEFKVPDAKTRRNIWSNFAELIKIPDVNLYRFADNYELTGGEIRNVALKALAFGITTDEQLEDICQKQFKERTGEASKIIRI